jgi:undecaprenyl diphosphate synthase
MVADKAAAGKLDPSSIKEETLEAELSTHGLPDLDLVIRTSGEKRLSNFLLWQAAYAELIFVDTLWPDFGEEEFAAAMTEFAGRQRRFGGR